jgi:hypothetical protein
VTGSRPPLWRLDMPDDLSFDAAVYEDDAGGGLLLYANDGGDVGTVRLDQANALALLDALETWRGRHAL